MKRLLLTGAMLVALSFSAKAQSTSFEEAQGFTLGDVNGQQGWTSTALTDEAGEITGYIENQTVSEEEASEGAWSLKLDKEAEFPGQSETIVGAFKNFETTEDFSVSASFYIGQQSLNDSDFALSVFGSESLAAQMQFLFDGNIVFRFPGTNSQGQQGLQRYLFDQEPMWEPETWYTIELAYTAATDTFLFSLDGEPLTIEGFEDGLPSLADGDLMATVGVRHDNYGGFAYVDNVVMTGATANVDTNNIAGVSVYPNPSNSIINIANVEGLKSASIVDINGRTVKNVNFAGTNQVNISDLSNGVYMMTINSDKGSVTKKIVKN